MLLGYQRDILDMKDGHGDTALHTAIMAGSNAHECICLLLEHGANPNLANDDGASPLHLAFNCERVTVETLVRFGANVNIQDSHGNTPLLEMARHGNAQNIAALLAAGAAPGTKHESCTL